MSFHTLPEFTNIADVVHRQGSMVHRQKNTWCHGPVAKAMDAMHEEAGQFLGHNTCERYDHPPMRDATNNYIIESRWIMMNIDTLWYIEACSNHLTPTRTSPTIFFFHHHFSQYCTHPSIDRQQIAQLWCLKWCAKQLDSFPAILEGSTHVCKHEVP